MGFSLYDILEPPIEPCEGCGEYIDIDAPDTYSFTPTDSVVCCDCEERQIAFEDSTEVWEEVVV